jgi:4-carboxymuconolactone decarboxylase
MNFKQSLAIFFFLIAGVSMAADRLPVIDPEKYTSDQKAAAEAFEQARHTPVFGPFEPLMHSPEVMTQARSMGDYLRYHSAIGNTLSEMVILITAREWTQDYEWHVHYPIAIKAGLKEEIAQAIRDARRPTGMTDDEDMIYDFSIELHRYKRVSDATFARVEARFGKKGVVDLVGINGYYTFLAMQMNTAQYALPKDGVKLPRLPE